MKSKIPMTKKEWNALEPKLRFRAFTVARLSQLDYIEAVRGRLISAMEKGEGYASTWKDIKAIAAEDGAINFTPGYWETVYRTNTQTAYTAGKLMQFKDNPPPAWRLLIIDDDRTSGICRGLVRDGKQSLVMASDHPFWKTFGYPPYHFNCRTGLQAVYKSEIGNGTIVENPSMKSLRKEFTPMDGFGGNPLDNGNYWMMTKGMFKRGLYYGVINEFNQLDNIVKDFDSLWIEYERKTIGKGWIDIHKSAFRNNDFNENYKVAQKLAKDGEHIKMLPEHKGKGITGWKNPDYLMNSNLWELESPCGSLSSIDDAIHYGIKQAPNIILNIPKNADRDTVFYGIKKRVQYKNNAEKIRNLIIYFGDEREQYTTPQILLWNTKKPRK
jgi:SPP1 gp7 family putative phage head morphogenesis protein